jgi:hypothetical protein
VCIFTCEFKGTDRSLKFTNVTIVTNDQEFAGLEKKLAEVQRQADSLLADAQAFRDGVAGQFAYGCHMNTPYSP